MWFIKIICVYTVHTMDERKNNNNTFVLFIPLLFWFLFLFSFLFSPFLALSLSRSLALCVLKHENVCSRGTWANKCSIYFFILLCLWCCLVVLLLLLFSLQFIRMLHFAVLPLCVLWMFVEDYFVVASVVGCYSCLGTFFVLLCV